MIDSPCYVSGDMSCLSCHTMHQASDDDRKLSAWADDQLGRGMDTDRACTQCHEAFADPQQRTAHTRHSAQSEGSHCYNCHMPKTSYGLLKAMRSHRISVPSARETIETGRPNACNLCHLDKSLGWTADKLRERHGIASPELPPDARELPLALWMGATGDAGQRALIAAALGSAPAQAASDQRDVPALLGVLMDDPYDAVRYIAGHSLESLPGVDAASLHYDFVPRPNTRQPMAARVAGLTKLSPSDRARLTELFARLLPTRDHRAVVLLE
jgi:Cytochrome c7 and related cytochrome c